jgi:hypothetical protein
MKTPFSVIIILLITITAGAVAGHSANDTYLYRDDMNQFQELPPDYIPCPPGNIKQCQTIVGSRLRYVYYQDETPYMRD